LITLRFTRSRLPRFTLIYTFPALRCLRCYVALLRFGGVHVRCLLRFRCYVLLRLLITFTLLRLYVCCYVCCVCCVHHGLRCLHTLRLYVVVCYVYVYVGYVYVVTRLVVARCVCTLLRCAFVYVYTRLRFGFTFYVCVTGLRLRLFGLRLGCLPVVLHTFGLRLRLLRLIALHVYVRVTLRCLLIVTLLRCCSTLYVVDLLLRYVVTLFGYVYTHVYTRLLLRFVALPVYCCYVTLRLRLRCTRVCYRSLRLVTFPLTLLLLRWFTLVAFVTFAVGWFLLRLLCTFAVATLPHVVAFGYRCTVAHTWLRLPRSFTRLHYAHHTRLRSFGCTFTAFYVYVYVYVDVHVYAFCYRLRCGYTFTLRFTFVCCYVAVAILHCLRWTFTYTRLYVRAFTRSFTVDLRICCSRLRCSRLVTLVVVTRLRLRYV